MTVWVAPTNENAGPNQNWVVVWEYQKGSAMYGTPTRETVSHHRKKSTAISKAKQYGRKKGDRQILIKNKNGGTRQEMA